MSCADCGTNLFAYISLASSSSWHHSNSFDNTVSFGLFFLTTTNKINCVMKTPTCVVLVIGAVFAVALYTTSADADRVGTCIRNCAQCKKMFGPYFDGLLCADTCVKYKGKIIPDAEDPETIEIYLRRVNKTEPVHEYKYTGNYVNQEYF